MSAYGFNDLFNFIELKEKIIDETLKQVLSTDSKYKEYSSEFEDYISKCAQLNCDLTKKHDEFLLLKEQESFLELQNEIFHQQKQQVEKEFLSSESTLFQLEVDLIEENNIFIESSEKFIKEFDIFGFSVSNKITEIKKDTEKMKLETQVFLNDIRKIKEVNQESEENSEFIKKYLNLKSENKILANKIDDLKKFSSSNSEYLKICNELKELRQKDIKSVYSKLSQELERLQNTYDVYHSMLDDNFRNDVETTDFKPIN